MIAVDVALARVLAGLGPLGSEVVGLGEALGRVLAEDVQARLSHPPMDVSSMDGYACRAGDAGASRLVVGESAAGHPATLKVGPGQAVRIFTGAALPNGADCVVMQEECRRDGDRVTFTTLTGLVPGRFVRAAGQDFAPGRPLMPAGTVLGPRQLALAAAMNLPWLNVHRRPRVAILSTGDEIVLPGEPMTTGQITSANGSGLAALVTAQGGTALHLGIAQDSRASLTTMVGAARGCDLMVISGGASVGDYDLVHDVLAEQGLDLDFWKIALRPGKPLMFGQLHKVPVLGLPGNPVSAMVCAYVFLRPMLRALLGLAPRSEMLTARLETDLKANDARQDYLRASLTRHPDGSLTTRPFDRQDSGMIALLAAAGCLVVRPPHAPAAQAGDQVAIIALDEGQ